MNAMKNSLSNTGDDGVTMMAGSSAFSSTRGRVRSGVQHQCHGRVFALHRAMISYVPSGAGISV